MKVFGYIRVSGRGQVEGDGPERQCEAIKKFCADTGLEFAGISQEQISGTSDALERAAFSEMLETIYVRATSPTENISGIVVERMDRLARDLMVSEVLLKECREHGIKVFSADQGALIDMASDGGDPTRVLIRQIMGALAEWEKSNLVKKLAAARKRKKERTGRCEGYAPLSEMPGGQTTIDTIHQLRTSGITLPEIAKLLNNEGIKTRRGKRWSVFSVLYVLQNNKPTGQK